MPRIVTGRIRTLEEAEQILRDGIADLISLTRAQIADPDLVRKTRDGTPEQVRPCVACNQGCIGGLFRFDRMGCLVNPAVGFEAELSEDLLRKTDSAKKVLIIGGGPAGMEAARIARLKGHTVVLVEAMPNLGGNVSIARRAPFLHTMGDITSWLEQEVYRVGVEVRLNTFADADYVRTERADVVIIATGSEPRRDGLQALLPGETVGGVDRPHVLSSIDLITGTLPADVKTALVLDDVGHYEAIAVTDVLLAAGVGVTFVTRYPMLTPIIEFTQRTTAAMERFSDADFTLLTRTHLCEIRERDCLVRPVHGVKRRVVAAERVVLVTANRPRSEIYDALLGTVPGLLQIGDAKAPRDAQAAIAEGRRAAWSLN
jgi:heterodisulfide reductase subunit A-like polyferredoxin